MNIYFAPLEGITIPIYRNVHARHYSGIEKYYAPFITTNQFGPSKKKLRNILPENNGDYRLIPQLLGNNASDFIEYSKGIAQLGYTEVNLNLGCPSRTVTTKKKGSGFLQITDELERFLDEIYKDPALNISIKTRIGYESEEEWEKLLEIYNKYPIYELTIHPRTTKEMYSGHVHLDMFDSAYAKSNNPLCYNGDIVEADDIKDIKERYPDIENVMIGRGLLKNPGLAEGNGSLDIKKLREFHDDLFDSYMAVGNGEKNVLFKMKELWFYWAKNFDDEKAVKKIIKAQKASEYLSLTKQLF